MEAGKRLLRCCCIGLLGAVLMRSLTVLTYDLRECSFDDKTTAAEPCNPALFLGDTLSLTCGKNDTRTPSDRGKFCATPLKSDTDDCPKAIGIGVNIAMLKRAGDKEIVDLITNLFSEFSSVLTLGVRCKQAGSGRTLFVAARIMPFRAPLEERPNPHTFGMSGFEKSNPTVLYGAMMGEGEIQIICPGRLGGSLTPPTVLKPDGKFCDRPIAGAGSGGALTCPGREKPWTSINALVSSADGNRLIIDRKQVGEPAVAFMACRKGNVGVNAEIRFMGMKWNPPTAATVKEAEHYCTGGDGVTFGKPCDVTLAVGETLVISCANVHGGPAHAWPGLMPKNIDNPAGSYCETLPANPGWTCQNRKPWKNITIKSDPVGKLFTITNDKEGSTKRADLTAYGYCGHDSAALSWKILVKGQGKTEGQNGQDDGSSAISSTKGCFVAVFLALAVAALAGDVLQV